MAKVAAAQTAYAGEHATARSNATATALAGSPPTSSPTATSTPGPTGTPKPTAPVGEWEFKVDVTVANGNCADEVDDPVQVRRVTITQTGSQVQVAGLGDPGTAWPATWQPPTLTPTGTRRENFGTTSMTFTMTLTSPDAMKGTESWSWQGADGATCPDGLADVTARRLGP